MELRLLGYAILITFLFELYAVNLMFNMTRNLYVFHLLTPIQYALYALVFFKTLQDRKLQRFILLSIPLFFLAALLITFYLQPPSEFNAYTSSMKNVLLACWVLLYYKEVFTGLRIIRLSREPMFWVSTGLLFYSLGSFFLYGLMNHLLVKSYEIAHMLYYFSEFLGYILYITISIAFLFARRPRLLLL